MLEANLSRFVLPKDLKLIEIKREGNRYVWHVEKIRQAFEICPRCAAPSKTRAGRCRSRVKDQPLRGESLELLIHKHRYYCKPCRKPFSESVSIVWPRRRTTQRLRRAVAKAAGQFVDLDLVRRTFRVSSGFIYKVYYEQLKLKLREREGAGWPEVLGIDEHFFRRRNWGTEFVTVFTDLKRRQLFEIALGKDTKGLMEQLERIPGREKVRVVAIDLSNGYRALVRKLFPNAKIVGDKFHVLRLITPSIMRAGKQIHGHRQELKLRRLLLVNRRRLDYFLRSDLDRYLKNHPGLEELYRFKERIYEFYRIKGLTRAVKALRKLTDRMQLSTLPEIQKLRRTLLAWRNEILLYFENGYTNAFTEAMNNVGKLVQKRGYGYRSFENYRLRTLCARLF
jgi:transposase